VLQTGEVGAGDAVEVVERPEHGVTTGQLFRATTTQKHRIDEIAPALAHLPVKDQPKVAAKIDRLLAARA
jgi:MOSC domain-containing protein YiiM